MEIILGKDWQKGDTNKRSLSTKSCVSNYGRSRRCSERTKRRKEGKKEVRRMTKE